MANEKRKRQRAAKAAKQADAPANDKVAAKAAEPGALPDVPNADETPAPKKTATKKAAVNQAEVVSETPGRRAPAKKDSAADARRQAVRDVRLKKQRNLAFRRFAIIAAAVILAFVVIGFLLSGEDGDAPFVAQDDANYVTFLASSYGTGECAEGGPAPDSFDDAPQLCITQGDPLQAVFDTSLGTVVAELNTTQTLGTANNFVNLARSEYYSGLEVFRTDPLTASVYSGAAANDQSDVGPGYAIPDEATGFVYGPGLLAMSRTTDANSAGSAYFFTVGDEAEALDAQGNFVVFGQVTEGLAVLEQILDLHVPDAGAVTGGRPSETVTINSVTIEPIPEEG